MRISKTTAIVLGIVAVLAIAIGIVVPAVALGVMRKTYEEEWQRAYIK